MKQSTTLSIALLTIVIVVSGLLPLRAEAKSGPWVQFDAGRIRLVAAQIDQQHFLAVDFQLADGWHTYWRHPGASGIAPQFELIAPSDVILKQAIYPAPRFFEDGAGGFNGYDDATGFVLPFTIAPSAASSLGKPQLLKLRAMIGVCRDICIPLSVDLSLNIDAAGLRQKPSQKLIANLLAQRPQPPSDDLFIAAADYDGANLYLRIKGKALQQPRIFIEPTADDVIGPPSLLTNTPGEHIFKLSAWSSLDRGLIGRKLAIVVRDQHRAIEQNIEVMKASN